jgi:hypothetical protein
MSEQLRNYNFDPTRALGERFSVVGRALESMRVATATVATVPEGLVATKTYENTFAITPQETIPTASVNSVAHAITAEVVQQTEEPAPELASIIQMNTDRVDVESDGDADAQPLTVDGAREKVERALAA